jgi:hypothetical protein
LTAYLDNILGQFIFQLIETIFFVHFFSGTIYLFCYIKKTGYFFQKNPSESIGCCLM